MDKFEIHIFQNSKDFVRKIQYILQTFVWRQAKLAVENYM